MNAAAVDIVEALTRATGTTARKQGRGWQVRCPGHDDRIASLSVSEGEKGTVLYCHAGCSTDRILEAAGLSMSDLFSGNGKHADQPRQIVAEYDYSDELGNVLYDKQKAEPKNFYFRRRDLKSPSGWVSGPGCMTGVRRVLFGLPELKAAIERGEEIAITEGEKDAVNTRKLGFAATTWDSGATKGEMNRKWIQEFTAILANAAHVFLFPHNDEAGYRAMEYIATQLSRAGCADVRIVIIPGLSEGEDISDHIARGGTAEDLLALIDAAPQWKPDESTPRAETPATVTGTLDELKATELTELATANRLKQHHGQDLRHAKGYGYLHWTGRVWAVSEKGAARLAYGMGKIIRQEAAKHKDPDVAKAFFQHARSIERSEGTRAILSIAKALPGIDGDDIEWDFDPWLLNCLNGTVDLRTGEFREHRREDYLTKIVPVPYVPKATAPRWGRFLQEIFQGDRDVVDYFAWLCGYALTGNVNHDLFVIAWGSGLNGKTTAISTLQRVWGEDYSQQIDAEELLQQKYGRHSTGIAALRGARLVVAQESGESRRLNEALVKGLSGGDKVRARFIGMDGFEFFPCLKLVIVTNHKPVIKDDSLGLWRRVRLIPFERTFQPDERDPELRNTLQLEREGILSWAVQHATRAATEPTLPAKVRVATEAYRGEQDTLGQFIAECCAVAKDLSVEKGRLYRVYTEWTSGRCDSHMMFTAKLRARGFDEFRDRAGNRCWIGISLTGNDLHE